MYSGSFNWCVLFLLTVVQFASLNLTYSEDFDEPIELPLRRKVLDILPRYLLYDVNKPEGFNLRRDVFIRMASLTHLLNIASMYEWILVLPPWHRLYHWRSYNLVQDRLPWSLFFNVDAIKKITPVIELHEFFSINGIRPLDLKVTLQSFNLKSFEDFNEKWEIADCKGYVQTEFWNLKNLTFTKSLCVSFQGDSTLLGDFIEQLQPRTVIFDHAELTLHDYYSDYKIIRKSMQFSNDLHEIAKVFKEKHLKRNYMCVHLRRGDFLYSHPNDVPSIKETARQIITKLKFLKKIKIVFIATDAPKKEIEDIFYFLQPYPVFQFEADKKTLNTYKDGGVAIIDQIICSQANYFIGTSNSTFSFQIREERDILGFPLNTTYNSFCGDNDKNCTQPTKWR